MTRTAWFHCFAGVAGDMVLGALLDAGADAGAVRETVGRLDAPGWTIEPTQVARAGLMATLAGVRAPADDAHHRPYRVIRDLIAAAGLPPRVERRALATFAVLAGAEGALHGVAADDVELHEVGALDAIVDVVGTCAALEALGIDDVVCSPISVGMGTVHAAHGTLPHPAPAVAAIAASHNVPFVGLEERLELATPTGVALMAALAPRFGPVPSGTVVAAGLGAGGRDTAGRPNVVQVLIVENATTAPESLVELATNVDDVTGEVLAHTISQLLGAGALDAWATPIVMKKGRPAHTVHALARSVDAAALREVLLRETGSLGVRLTSVERFAADREAGTVHVDGHPIRVKRTAHRVKVEHDDAVVAAAASGRPLRDVLADAEALARGSGR